MESAFAWLNQLFQAIYQLFPRILIVRATHGGVKWVDQIPVRMIRDLVVGQLGGLALELSGVHVPLPPAWVLFPEGKIDELPAARHGSAHDGFGLVLRVIPVLQEHLDV